MKLPDPFAYPMQAHIRRHGPQGYSKHGEYRNWLRDEFAFRCVYCLRRETWWTLPRDFEIDHILPVSKRKDLRLDYDNLCYACAECNGTKLAKILSSPDSIAYGECLVVDTGGIIHARNGSLKGMEIIEGLDLNAPKYVRMRQQILTTIADDRSGNKTLKFCLGYPDNLPDLSKEREPKPNKRPNGILESHFARKHRDELPEFY
jgi:hypothetical protein